MNRLRQSALNRPAFANAISQQLLVHSKFLGPFHQQLRVSPRLRLELTISLLLPHSHKHRHFACLWLDSPANAMTMSRPNRSPVRSFVRVGRAIEFVSAMTMLLTSDRREWLGSTNFRAVRIL